MTGLQVQELPKREPSEVIALDDSVQFRILLFQAHHAGSCENNLQTGVQIMTLPQLMTPVGFLEHLVDEQYLTAILIKRSCKVGNASSLEIEVVHVEIEAFAVVRVEMFLGILEQEGGFTHTTSSLDADHAVVPVYLVHEKTANGRIDMLHKV